MQRAQLEHVIRAATTVADDEHLVIIGSQSILGSFPDAPPAMLRSVEADVFPRDHPERAVVIEGAIGEGSPFHETFGYYAHAVGPETAVVGPGWEDRLVAVRNDNTRGATGWCLEPHDTVVAKLAAGRDHDLVFASEALRAGLVSASVLEERIAVLGVDAALAAHARSMLTLAVARSGGPSAN